MATLVSTIVAHVKKRAHFRTLQDTDALELFELVYRDLTTRLPRLQMVQDASLISLNLAGGIREYALPDSLIQIDSVYYRTDATNAAKLMVTSLESLNSNGTAWRADPNGTPTKYYLTSDGTQFKIGLVDKPNLTTALGYPVLEVSGIERATPTFVLANAVPATVNSWNVFVEGICYYGAFQLRPDAISQYLALYNAAIDREIAFQETFNAERRTSQPLPVKIGQS